LKIWPSIWTNQQWGNLEGAVNEEQVFWLFAHGDLSYLDAIEILQREVAGYDAKEAERVVSKWAEGLETAAEWAADKS
jgi:hypothetical protein